MESGVEDIVAIMIPEPKGKEIVSLLERNITVTMHITIGTRNLQKYVSRTSVVFVSISFIVLMIISLAWLVFYYIQRFRYANARDRNQRRLGDAAKKAISKLQVRTIRKGDKETESDFDNCAVCIEGYKPNDVVRILPCRHLFHKSCVDPWLLDHRTCPMCKMNILKALGIPPNADCMDDLPIDFEGSLGGPPTNQITGASDTTVNESSVTLDPAVRTVGALQVVQDPDPVPQEGEAIFTTNKFRITLEDKPVDKPVKEYLHWLFPKQAGDKAKEQIGTFPNTATLSRKSAALLVLAGKYASRSVIPECSNSTSFEIEITLASDTGIIVKVLSKNSRSPISSVLPMPSDLMLRYLLLKALNKNQR
ncbi:RING finger protein [Cricetulus griseus]|uniref:RING finger protein n=1 Tax=Cricetulus griseus TaxID=10029 RepID=A0A061ICL7_CRIGR|nr:RING finger protein [Cricetulus griseus]